MTHPPTGNTGTISIGVPGIDTILRGGLTRDRLYLLEGMPGSGKTTIAMQFLTEGVAQGEKVLYVTLSETTGELLASAQSHGWTLEGIDIHEVLPSESALDPDEQYTIFHPTEVELGRTTQQIVEAVERVKPSRLVIDSLSELQLLAANSLRYRRQVLAFKQFFSTRACTVLLLDDRSTANGDLEVRSIAHGVLSLNQLNTDFGGTRRRMQVIKYRGVPFIEGMHDYLIRHGGVVVFPRLVASSGRIIAHPRQFRTGVETLDALLGGGIEEGTSTLLAGPPGTGKSSLAAQIAASALEQGGRAAMFIFEESISNFLNRTDGLNIPLRPALEAGALTLRQIDPAQVAPGEFIHDVCESADRGAKVVVIDSLNGFLNAMPNERLLTTHLHELLTYLGQRGVVTVLIGVHQGMLGGQMSTAIDASYLADNVVMLRYFECRGEVRQALSVFKKRGSSHERTIREMSMSSSGIQVGPVLRQFQGVLTGVPTMLDDDAFDLDAPA
jgi:circadian clock protein KaiC